MKPAISLALAVLLSACGAVKGLSPDAPKSAPAQPAAVIDHHGAGPLLSDVQAGKDVVIHIHQPVRPGAPGGGNGRPRSPAAETPGGPPPPWPVSQLATIHELREALRAHEGLSLRPYTLRGEIHECYGSLGSDGLPKSSEECERQLAEKMRVALDDARVFVGGAAWARLTPRRRAVVAELAYMTGRPRLEKFVRFRAALRGRDYRAAAAELQDSPALIADVGQRRVDDLKERLLEGAGAERRF